MGSEVPNSGSISILGLLDTHRTVEELERYLMDIEEKWELTPDSAASRAAKKIFDALKGSE
jgi:hypothetical protein